MDLLRTITIGAALACATLAANAAQAQTRPNVLARGVGSTTAQTNATNAVFVAPQVGVAEASRPADAYPSASAYEIAPTPAPTSERYAELGEEISVDEEKVRAAEILAKTRERAARKKHNVRSIDVPTTLGTLKNKTNARQPVASNSAQYANGRVAAPQYLQYSPNYGQSAGIPGAFQLPNGGSATIATSPALNWDGSNRRVANYGQTQAPVATPAPIVYGAIQNEDDKAPAIPEEVSGASFAVSGAAPAKAEVQRSVAQEADALESDGDPIVDAVSNALEGSGPQEELDSLPPFVEPDLSANEPEPAASEPTTQAPEPFAPVPGTDQNDALELGDENLEIEPTPVAPVPVEPIRVEPAEPEKNAQEPVAVEPAVPAASEDELPAVPEAKIPEPQQTPSEPSREKESASVQPNAAKGADVKPEEAPSPAPRDQYAPNAPTCAPNQINFVPTAPTCAPQPAAPVFASYAPAPRAPFRSPEDRYFPRGFSPLAAPGCDGRRQYSFESAPTCGEGAVCAAPVCDSNGYGYCGDANACYGGGEYASTRHATGLIAGAEWLSWKTDSDSTFARVASPALGTIAERDLKTKGDGLRGRIGVRSASGWDLIGTYTRFDSDESGSISAFDLPRLYPNANAVLVSPKIPGDAPLESISAKLKTKLENVDLEVGRWIECGPFSLRPFAGFRWTQFNEETTDVFAANGVEDDLLSCVAFTDENVGADPRLLQIMTAIPGDSTSALYSHSRLNAYGLRVGADVEIELIHCFSVYGRGAGTIAAGDVNSKSYAVVNGAPFAGKISKTYMTPSVEGALGLSWRYCGFEARAGYEFNAWYNAANHNGRKNDFLAHGYVAGLGWNY